MKAEPIGSTVADALSLEYKRDYGCAFGNLELSDLVNYPPLARELSRVGLGFPEESLRLVLADVGALSDNIADASLIGLNGI